MCDLNDCSFSVQKERFLVTVRENGLALKDMPEAFRTAELCLAAIEENGCALEDVPESIKTKEICDAALSQCADAIKFVPSRYLDSQR